MPLLAAVQHGEGVRVSDILNWINPFSRNDVYDNYGASMSSLRQDPEQPPSQRGDDALLVLLPLLIILSTFLFLLLIFIACVLLLRKRRGILLRDSDGPIDMSREEMVDGEGGFEGVESRWLETVDEEAQRSYMRAKGNASTTSSMTVEVP